MCQSCVALKAGDLVFLDEPFNLLLSPEDATGEARCGIGPDRLHVAFGPKYARRAHVGDTIIDAKWQQALADDPELADGPLFRLEKVEWAEGGSAANLCLGVTTVKEYIGSNRLPLPMRQLRRQDGIKKENDQEVHMSNPLGCEVLLVTSDNKAVLLWCTEQSSQLTPTRFSSRDEGRFSSPWAEPQPERVGVDGTAEATTEMQQRIAAELFDAAIRGVEERISVPREKLSQPRLIGCMVDSRHYKPELLFQVHTSLDAPGVRALYAEHPGGNPDFLDFWPMASLSDCPVVVTCVVRAVAQCVAALAPSEPVWKEHPASAAPPAARQSAKAKPKPKPEAKAKATAEAGASSGGSAPTWRVVGGADKGIIVREACDKTSPEMPRLAHGSLVEEIERSGDRLHYRKLEGDGADSGWVSIGVNGKELLVRE